MDEHLLSLDLRLPSDCQEQLLVATVIRITKLISLSAFGALLFRDVWNLDELFLFLLVAWYYAALIIGLEPH